MKMENPYESPQASAGTIGTKGDLKGYWIEGGCLHIADGAELPDVCLESGSCGEGIERGPLKINDRVSVVLLVLSVLGFLLSGIAMSPVIPMTILLLLLFVMLLLRKSIKVGVGMSDGARFRRRLIQVTRIVVGVAICLFMTLSPLSPEDRLFIGMGGGLLALALMMRYTHAFRVVRIRDQVAVIERIHPEALEHLKRIRYDQLSKFLPVVPLGEE